MLILGLGRSATNKSKPSKLDLGKLKIIYISFLLFINAESRLRIQSIVTQDILLVW